MFHSRRCSKPEAVERMLTAVSWRRYHLIVQYWSFTGTPICTRKSRTIRPKSCTVPSSLTVLELGILFEYSTFITGSVPHRIRTPDRGLLALAFWTSFKRHSSWRFWTAVVTCALYCICKCLDNLCLQPLSRCPGPKLVAIGFLYEFCYDVIKDGRYLWEVDKMHRKYGNDNVLNGPGF